MSHSGNGRISNKCLTFLHIFKIKPKCVVPWLDIEYEKRVKMTSSFWFKQLEKKKVDSNKDWQNCGNEHGGKELRFRHT